MARLKMKKNTFGTGRYGYLFKNIGLLTLSNFGSKILGFLLVPLYTNILTTEEYGVFDLLYTTASLLIPIFTLDIVEAVLRFSLDKTKDKKDIFSTGIKTISISFVFLALFMTVNYYVCGIPAINQYLLFFALFYISHLLLQYMQYFIRGIERVADLSVSGVINSAGIMLLNILFLVVLKKGIEGYMLANIIANMIAVMYLAIRAKVWHYIRYPIQSKQTEKEMFSYSRPLVINAVGWWINNASDRYIVTWISGLAANGVYSVGYKIPSVLNVLQSIFNQAWQLSTVKELDRKDSNEFFTKIYSNYNALIVLACSGLILFARVMAHFLYAKDFFEAWRYVPFLTISVVFGGLSGVLGGIFQAFKDSKTMSLSALMGAIINLILNVFLVYLIGPLGAAFATVTSYFVVWVFRFIRSRKYVIIKINVLKDSLCYLILLIQAVVMLFLYQSPVLLYIIETLCLLFIFLLYYKVIISSIKAIVNKNK